MHSFDSYPWAIISASVLNPQAVCIGDRSGLHITPHALRRTFATLSLKAGMDVFQLQALLGHSSLEMTRHYVRLVDEDLVNAHKAYGPIDKMLKYNIK